MAPHLDEFDERGKNPAPTAGATDPTPTPPHGEERRADTDETADGSEPAGQGEPADRDEQTDRHEQTDRGQQTDRGSAAATTAPEAQSEQSDQADEHAEPPQETDGEPPRGIPALSRFRILALLAVGPLFTGYVAVATLLAVVTAMASNARFTTYGVLNAAVPAWLAAHQVPIKILGLELGVLPLLPTAGVVWLTARAAGRAAERLDLHRPGQAGPVITVAAVAHATAGVVIVGLTIDAGVTADPLAALGCPALLAAFAAALGVARPCGLVSGITRQADAVAVAGLRAGLVAVVLLLAAGGAVLTFGLATSIPAARDLFPAGLGNAAGMLLLSIGYLPNATIGAVSFIAGPGFTLGTFTVSPLEFDGGAVSAVPLLAALPERQAIWWPVFFVLPLVVGIITGGLLRYVDDDPVARLRAVAVATGVVAVCFVVLAAAAGGRLGRGAFDPVVMNATAVAIALVLWTAVPGAVVAWFSGPRAAAAHIPGLIDDEEDEYELARD